MVTDFLPTNEGFSAKVYNALKWVTLILLPALSALYFALSGSLDLPNPEAVMGVLASIATFLGTLLGISNRNYNASDAQYDGSVVIQHKPDGGTMFNLDLDGDPADIPNMEKVTFKVVGGEPQFWDH